MSADERLAKMRNAVFDICDRQRPSTERVSREPLGPDEWSALVGLALENMFRAIQCLEMQRRLVEMDDALSRTPAALHQNVVEHAIMRAEHGPCHFCHQMGAHDRSCPLFPLHRYCSGCSSMINSLRNSRYPHHVPVDLVNGHLKSCPVAFPKERL